jgi:cobaltochelatase CobT
MDSSPFVDLDPDLKGRDLAEAIAGMITEDATSGLASSDYRVYTREWDRIEPLPIDEKEYNANWLVKLDEETRHMVGPMQKDIERMMAARSQAVHVPGYRSGRLHGGSLHRLMVKDDRVFRRKQEAPSKETAVTLLVDNSGSMSGPKMKTAAAVAYALSSTLERVGIAHEVIGFTTHYNISGKMKDEYKAEVERTGVPYTRVEPIYMPIYKGWDERLTADTKKRFAKMFSRADFLSQNIDGECIRIAAERLMRRREQRKVLIVLSDGSPACGSPFPHEITKDCKRAVIEVTKAHIETIGIGILTDCVKRFYPKHVVLNDLAELPKTVMGELKRILAA